MRGRFPSNDPRCPRCSSRRRLGCGRTPPARQSSPGPAAARVLDRPGQRRGVRKGHVVREEGLDFQLGIDSFLQPPEDFQVGIGLRRTPCCCSVRPSKPRSSTARRPAAACGGSAAKAGRRARPFRRGIAAGRQSCSQSRRLVLPGRRRRTRPPCSRAPPFSTSSRQIIAAAPGDSDVRSCSSSPKAIGTR